MFIRVLAVAGGLGGAAVLSQYPEFTQQYTQRLAGQVEALGAVVEDFDRSAQQAQMTREEALGALSGTEFLEARRQDMRATIARQARLAENLDVLRSATAMDRLKMPQRVADSELAIATWRDFRPALPLTLEGAIAAAGGFVAGWLLTGGLLRLLTWPLRRGRKGARGLDFHA